MLERIVGRVRRHLVAIVIAIVGLGGATLAVAAGEPSSKTGGSRIYACVTQTYSTLNLSSASARCPKGQRKISWSRTGRKGARGARGARGATGAAGAPGAPGVAGAQGAAGVPGAAGAAGAQGAVGAAGPKGDDGATGPAGPQGPKGDDGAAGAAGPQGPKGDDGATGPAGPQGPKGDDGATGPAGPQGPKGDDGATGPAGPQGPAGDSHVLQASTTTVVAGAQARTKLANWTIGMDTLGGLDAVTGTFQAPTAGRYRIAFDATGGPTTPVTVSSAAGQWLALTLERPDAAEDVVARRFPMLDVNVALVLTMRTPLRDASVSAERYVTLSQGERIELDVQNGLSSAMDLDVTLTVNRVS